MKPKVGMLAVSAIILILVIGTILFIMNKNHSSTTPTPIAHYSGCIAEQLNVGTTGSCVGDAQTMVDYMQTGGLTECPFSGGSLLPITGNFDETTKAQVQVVEKWENCYNKQEGSSVTISTSGIINTTAWSELCTYAYHYPLQSNSTVSSYRQKSLVAGKDAGCNEFFR
jgi:hypothetical protein